MNICLCGAEAGYPHDACCPYPLFRGSSNQVIAWEMAWAKNKQTAQQNAHLTPESLASSQTVVNTSALEQSDGDTPPAQAQVA